MTALTTYGAAERQGGKTAVPLPLLLLIVSFCLPAEVAVMAGPLRLSPFRVILLVTFLPNLAYLLGGRIPMKPVDILIIAHGLWVVIALMVSMGPAQAIETGGIYMVETVGAYLIARRHIQHLGHVEAVARLIAGLIAFLCVAAFLESITGVHMLREMFRAVLGGPGPHDMDTRMGLERAFTSFEHPILFGTFAASGAAFSYYVLGQATLQFKALVRLGLVVLATFFSLSGGPFVALGLQGFLIAWDRFTKGINHRWAALGGLFAGIWFMLTLASNRSPVLVFISYLTFSTQSAYNRVHIWTYGSAEVGRHPLFGIGLNDWIRAPWMSDSMDTFWLLTAVRYGLPSVLLLLSAMIVIGVSLNRTRASSVPFKHAVKAWMVTMAGLSLAALTVHFWNALMVQFFFLIGLGAALSSLRVSQPVPQISTPYCVQHSERSLSWI